MENRKTNKTDLDTKNTDPEASQEKTNTESGGLKFELKKRSIDEKIHLSTFGFAALPGKTNSVMIPSGRVSTTGRNESVLDYKAMSEFYITSQMLSRFKHKRSTIGGQDII